MNMEPKVKNLYQVWMRGWPDHPYVYVAADCRQEAVDHVSEMFDDEDKTKFNVEFLDVVYI